MLSLARQKRRLQGYKGQSLSLDRTDLRSAKAFASAWEGCTFNEVNFNLTDFTNASFTECEFTLCTGLQANFFGARFVNCKIRDADFEQANFSACWIDQTIFAYSRLCYTVFHDATLWNTTIKNCNLHGAELLFHQTRNVDYAGSNLWGVKVALGCPFFQSKFDEKQKQMFVALVARIWPENNIGKRLEEYAGEEFALVERLMRDEDGDITTGKSVG